MGGHNPVGWAATLLIAVAYAHVLLELAAAVLAIAVAARLLLSPARELIETRRRRELDQRRWPSVIERRPASEPERHPSGPASQPLSHGCGGAREPKAWARAPRSRANKQRISDEGEDDMIEISISGELAAEHPRFMAACAERGRRVEVFDRGDEGHRPVSAGPGENEREPLLADERMSWPERDARG